MSAALAPRAIVTTPGDREIHIERIFNAPRDRVWRAFTDPDQLKQWWGRGNEVVIEKHDFQRGGHWRFVEHSKEGVHGFEGRFREIKPMDRVERTFEWDGMPGYVIIESADFADLGDGRTKVTIRSLFYSQEERDGMLNSGMEGGMNQSFEALDRLLAKG
jgi:uncharacterized protein YndB with AHSA1/START domain